MTEKPSTSKSQHWTNYVADTVIPLRNSYKTREQMEGSHSKMTEVQVTLRSPLLRGAPGTATLRNQPPGCLLGSRNVKIAQEPLNPNT